ncbi:endolytic transglycosylase MltG [Orrella sp. JC864]|uniref:endolytic transglycosylase MltG n=1 Tax=Orrella sp. JC864 TaxID=3120298 RepID=UPI0012BCD505
MKKTLRILLLAVFLPLVLLAGGLAAGAWWWVERPLALPADRVDFVVDPGSGPAAVARKLNQAGIPVHPRAFALLARLTERDTLLKAGGYEARRGDTAWTLLDRIARGQMSQRQITLVEGWSYRQIRAALRAHPDVTQTLDGVSDAELLERLAVQALNPEGLFFPDTYVFTPGTSDFELLRQAHAAMQRELQAAWDQRAEGLPLATPYEALILASIIEKETGHGPERTRVGGVFINRLRTGMLLQTDPTVIYGMGEAYQGRIRKRDLQTDTPWNTYTRAGLPPTPIASPGRAALLAAVQPESHKYYYFVSRGDGTSQFSTNLAEHNRAVSRYILGRNP